MKFQNPILNFERTQMSKFAKRKNAKKCKGQSLEKKLSFKFFTRLPTFYPLSAVQV